MRNHIQLLFTGTDEPLQELLIARLSDAGYDGFEQEENNLKAFIPEAQYDPSFLKALATEYPVAFTEQLIPEENWNAVWESNFQPVRIDDFTGIRAGFHPPMPEVKHEIIITPKMSFGTGHHATTSLMVQQMKDIDFTGSRVFDFGTGTGILAILAEMLGAMEILAADNDDWSILNAAENIQQNNCSRIKLVRADKPDAKEQFNIILANINKNVILEHLPALYSQLKPGGIILLSGLLVQDEADILSAMGHYLIKHINTKELNGWICLKFSR